ncbi:MAG TPA: hypothetical protein PLB25_18340, partial [Rhodoferax sp.]|nr:hypothetical protein [Rhodoferax sp.]
GDQPAQRSRPAPPPAPGLAAVWFGWNTIQCQSANKASVSELISLLPWIPVERAATLWANPVEVEKANAHKE